MEDQKASQKTEKDSANCSANPTIGLYVFVVLVAAIAAIYMFIG